MLGLGLFAIAGALHIRQQRRLRRHVESEWTRLLGEFAKVHTRLDAVDERLADLTLMVDEASRPAVSDGRPPRD